MGVIVCDSASDLWKDQIQELNVKVINIPYSLDGEIQTNPLTNEEDHDLFYDKLKQGVYIIYIQCYDAKCNNCKHA